MAWTGPTAVFFIAIGSSLIVMTILELVRPNEDRRGFLPIVTSRGDRFFISLLSAAYLHLFWLGVSVQPLWWASLLSVVIAGSIMRWG